MRGGQSKPEADVVVGRDNQPTKGVSMKLMTMAVSLALAVTPVLAQTTSADGPAADSAAGVGVTTDAVFVKLATSSNILEIRSSELARDRAGSDAVKAFAERMIADHAAASAKLAEVAGQPAPDMSADLSGQMDAKHAEQLAALEAVTGEGFEQAYIDLQRQAHDAAVALFQSYATNGEDGAVKDFAEATVPTLQEHLTLVQDMSEAP
ncbi:DUF305 domain-containing protein [Gemmobacter aquarius]|uniref:DUF305 domain-containing protein n=2 Tax=Paragemmobacter aquarius TaxID=2169400 RepID=A0A2S0UKQ2_9RHOB|nr:DUF305 domain-containing protein [Gemmobacter aquarius]